MPPSVEPVVEQIEAAVETALGAIVTGSDYWYTPSDVARWGALTDNCLDPVKGKVGPIYLISHDRVEAQLGVARVVDRMLYLDIAAVSLLPSSTTPEGPFTTDAYKRYRTQNRMDADIRKKLTGGDLTLGGLAYNTEILTTSMDAEETWLDSWALVFLRVRISFRTPRSTP